jgi:hypothetical protein
LINIGHFALVANVRFKLPSPDSENLNKSEPSLKNSHLNCACFLARSASAACVLAVASQLQVASGVGLSLFIVQSECPSATVCSAIAQVAAILRASNPVVVFWGNVRAVTVLTFKHCALL